MKLGRGNSWYISCYCTAFWLVFINKIENMEEKRTEKLYVDVFLE